MHLLLRFARDAGRGRQLEHRRLLALAQTGDQDDLPVGEFQGVVVRVRAVHVAVAGQTDGRAVSDGSKTSHEKALHEQFGQPWHEKNMPHTERHIERNVLDIHVRANDGAQNLEIYARCFQWEQKFASLNSNASRSRRMRRGVARVTGKSRSEPIVLPDSPGWPFPWLT